MKVQDGYAQLERMKQPHGPTVRERELALWRERFAWDEPRLSGIEARRQLLELAAPPYETAESVGLHAASRHR
jgi:hypothetical protein